MDDRPTTVPGRAEPATPAGRGTDPRALRALETWFVRRGVPHFVETRTDGSILDTWTRALPLLVVAYLLLGLNALDLRDWTLGQNLAAAAAVVIMLVATWAASNRLRGQPTFARPTDIDPPELALFVIGPTLPVLAFGQQGDALRTVLTALALLAVIFLWSSYGVGPLLLWGARRSGGQLTGLGPLVARALPLLLLFNTFLFVNAEVWEVAGTLTGVAYGVIVATFFVLGASFAISRVPRFIRAQNRFDRWDDVVDAAASTPAMALIGERAIVSHEHLDGAIDQPLRPRQKANIGLVVLFGQALQITLVVAALIGFFVFFGVVAISATTMTNWTGLDELAVLAEADLGGRTLVLSESLVRVSVFLGAFSGMYFTVVLITDETYREEFASDLGPEIREALGARIVYLVARSDEHAAELAPDRAPGRAGAP